MMMNTDGRLEYENFTDEGTGNVRELRTGKIRSDSLANKQQNQRADSPAAAMKRRTAIKARPKKENAEEGRA